MPRKPDYLSPSALQCWIDSPREYYLRYLTETRMPKMAQTEPMSAGSAFDAYAKSYFHGALFGNNHKDSAKFGLRALFEAQVESQHRDTMWGGGAYLWKEYKNSGAVADLMLQMQGSQGEPQFEFDVRRQISSDHNMVLMGKPDVRFVTSNGVHVIYDWKVNGFCGKSKTSPTAGYIRLLENGVNVGPHKKAIVIKEKGLDINVACGFEDCDSKWAAQLATYGWLMGEPVGGSLVIGIHQLACDGSYRPMGYPGVRVAVHASRIGSAFQKELFSSYVRLWDKVQSSDSPDWHYFDSMSFEESKRECELLEKMAAGLHLTGDTTAAAILNMGR